VNNWENQSSEPYPTRNPDDREMNLGTTGRSYSQGYSNMDHGDPGVVESHNTDVKTVEPTGTKTEEVPQCPKGFKW
jgi:hypothetical protein